METIVLRYGEIGLKGKNRDVFENALVRDIREKTKHMDEVTIKRYHGRMYVDYESYDYDEIVDILTHTFGIVSISPVKKCDVTLEDMMAEAKSQVEELIQSMGSFTFKVEARRSNKGFYLTSPEIMKHVGGYINQTFLDQLRVDVHHPEIVVNIEVREHVYIYTKSIPGQGGMPYKTAGKGMLLLSGGIDSPVAGYLMAKRGVQLEAVHFHSYPFTSDRSKEKVLDLARKLTKYVGQIRVHSVNILEIQRAIGEHCPSEEMTILSRRFMMAIAERIANRRKYKSLITGENIAQVASQTMEGLTVTNSRVKLPVFRPLIAYDKVDIIKVAKKIDTYETSILPFEDCCTVFLPEKVVIKPVLEDIEASEAKLDVEDLINRAVKESESIILTYEH
ncbi:MAG: tRNA 4-thiouridine(8) synthase ThiI [Clostridia bacterium]|nr:tRNA 4-thiouridine(8) synthase ThiI [Clostridia bacterium]